jgi:hypothetical protein
VRARACSFSFTLNEKKMPDKMFMRVLGFSFVCFEVTVSQFWSCFQSHFATKWIKYHGLFWERITIWIAIYVNWTI